MSGEVSNYIMTQLGHMGVPKVLKDIDMGSRPMPDEKLVFMTVQRGCNTFILNCAQ